MPELSLIIYGLIAKLTTPLNRVGLFHKLLEFITTCQSWDENPDAEVSQQFS